MPGREHTTSVTKACRTPHRAGPEPYGAARDRQSVRSSIRVSQVGLEATRSGSYGQVIHSTPSRSIPLVTCSSSSAQMSDEVAAVLALPHDPDAGSRPPSLPCREHAERYPRDEQHYATKPAHAGIVAYVCVPGIVRSRVCLRERRRTQNNSGYVTPTRRCGSPLRGLTRDRRRMPTFRQEAKVAPRSAARRSTGTWRPS